MPRDTLMHAGHRGTVLSWEETLCACGASADRPGFKAPPGWYKCPDCREYTPRHMLMRRTAQRFGGGEPAGIDPYLRFYLPSTGLAAVNPAYDAGWTYTGGALDRKRCVTTRTNSATLSTLAIDPVGGALGGRSLFQQWVSDPVRPGTISGTVKGQARVASDTPNTYNQISINIKVVSNDGTTLRGDLIPIGEPGAPNAFTASLTNRYAGTGNPLTPVTPQTGDRLVFELGCFSTVDPRDVVAQLSMGDNSATDLPEDETTTAANNAWIQLYR